MTDFLLELRSEEIPARMQDRAREDLAKLFAAELAKAGLVAAELVTYATPRRLTLIARGLPTETAAVSEETKGPKASAPPQALEGFLRKTGLTREQLVERDGVLFAVLDKPGRPTSEVLALAIPSIVMRFPWPKSMRWGDSSRTTESLKWVRPLQGVVALFGDEVVNFPLDFVNVYENRAGELRLDTVRTGIKSGRTTVGHRFHHPGIITIANAADYVEKLRAGHVIVDQAERRQIIALGATMAARKAGLELVQDEGLLTENAGLTEFPVPLLGRFDAAFLDVPPEVIQLTARVNQKYFVCRDPAPLPRASSGSTAPRAVEDVPGAHPTPNWAGGGAVDDAAQSDMPSPNPSRKRKGDLANAFVCTANIDASDGGAAIIEGNRKVLAARLSDAKFFYDTDLKVPLEEQAKKLDRIVFHEKLGTVADKVDRVAKLARWLVEEGIVPPKGACIDDAFPGERRGPVEMAEPVADSPSLQSPAQLGPGLRRGRIAQMAFDAARLCKADLVTGMVGEFPELQGLMGGYYAAAQGEDPAVAAAIRDHYKPVGQGDDVPTDPVTVAVSLADKLDTTVSFFVADELPTGSKDPFALRRSALAIEQLIISNSLRVGLQSAVRQAAQIMFEQAADECDYDSDAFSGDPWKSLFLRSKEDGPDDKPAQVMGTVIPVYWRKQFAATAAQTGLPLLQAFFADRLKVQQREAGVRHDLIDAVFALGGEDDLVRLLARVHALQAFIGTADGANLLAGYKRAANILKKEGWESSAPLPHAGGAGGGPVGSSPPVADRPSPNPSREREGEGELSLSYTPEPAEAALANALDSAEPAAAAAIGAEDFAGAMAALATLRAPIDQFFESVIVNDAHADKRAARLALLDRVRAAVHNVADFSKIEG